MLLQLQETNEKLEEFCRQQRLEHESQLMRLQQQQAETVQHLTECKRQEERRQRDIDSMLLQNKRRNEETEVGTYGG